MEHSAALPVYDRHEGRGPTLVLLHYWGGSARTWDLVTEPLGDRDILAIDARGWSRSASLSGPYDLHRLAEDVLAVVNEADLADFVLVGHSMGGKVAQLVAAQHPKGLRGIVLVASGPATPPPEITPEYREALSHAYDSVESVEGARDAILTASELPEPLKAQIVRDSSASASAASREWPLHGIAEDISAETRRIQVPALVIAGERDQVEPVAVQQDHLLHDLADASLSVIPSTGHLIPLEAPAELAGAIESFVDGLQAVTGAAPATSPDRAR